VHSAAADYESLFRGPICPEVRGGASCKLRTGSLRSNNRANYRGQVTN
jgi:hypothetical protein